jgi:hypothetical protein
MRLQAKSKGAEDKAAEAAQQAADARALMYRVLADTANMLGLQ